jgi:hypothetical protein
MRHETDLSSTEAKAFFVRFWTGFLHMRFELPLSNVGNMSRSRIVGRDGVALLGATAILPTRLTQASDRFCYQELDR